MVLVGRTESTLAEAAAAISAGTGGEVHPLVHDMGDASGVASLLESLRHTVGDLDLLVLNAGGPAPGGDPRPRRRAVAGRVRAAAARTTCAWPRRCCRTWPRRGFGRVVWCSRPRPSVSPNPGSRPRPLLRAAVTSAAKLLSREYAEHGVTVNCVAPGATDTPRRREVLAARAVRAGVTPADAEEQDAAERPGRPAPGTPDEIAAAVEFLASAAAGYVNGDRAHGRRWTDGDGRVSVVTETAEVGPMGRSGEDFSMPEFLGAISAHGRPAAARPLVVHAEELELLPAGEVHNPSRLSIAGRLPTATFELFRQTIPAAESTDMQRHDHETVHYVIAGSGHSEIEDDTVTWSGGDYVYTPPWTWHRHWNDSADRPVEFLTIENSRLLALFGVGRRQSAGLVSMEQARALGEEGR